MTKDTMGTVRAIAKMGYEVVEFYGPYFHGHRMFAKEVRKAMDDVGLRCHSTHNDAASFSRDGIARRRST